MGEFFNANAVRISELLGQSGSFYKIPVLQRKYVWGEEEIQELLQDIKDSYLDSEPHYFIGGMVFAKDKNSQKLLVIDGQQRLITLMLLLAAARTKFKQSNNESLYTYYYRQFAAQYLDEAGVPQTNYLLELHGRDNDVFRKLLEESSTSITDYTDYTVSTKNLVMARDIIDEFVNDVADLQTYMPYVLGNVYAVRTIADDQSSAFMIFETLNNKGSQLQPEDLLKNLLLQSMDDEDYEMFAAVWQNFIQRLMNTKGLYVVQASTFLKHFIMSKGDYISKSKIFDWFDHKDRRPKDKERATQLLTELDQSAERYRQFIEGKGDSVIEAMKQLRFKQAYIVLLGSMNLPPTDRVKIYKLLESVAFSYIMTGAKTNELEKQFCSIAKLAREAAKESENIQEVIDRLRSIADDMKEKVMGALRAFKYKGRGDKNKVMYFLSRIAQSLDGADYSKFSIEHITPQNVSSPAEAHERIVASIGNLTLVNNSDNSSLKDKPFNEKREVYLRQACRLTSSLVKPIETATSNTKFDKAIKAYNYAPPHDGNDWREEEINHRTEGMINLAKYLWFESV